jgi:ABC-type transporter Mla MlaB component
MLSSGTASVIVCDVDMSRVDMVTVDALARIAVVARSRGRQMRLRRAPADLHALVQLIGLADVLRRCAGVR